MDVRSATKQSHSIGEVSLPSIRAAIFRLNKTSSKRVWKKTIVPKCSCRHRSRAQTHTVAVRKGSTLPGRVASSSLLPGPSQHEDLACGKFSRALDKLRKSEAGKERLTCVCWSAPPVVCLAPSFVLSSWYTSRHLNWPDCAQEDRFLPCPSSGSLSSGGVC